MLNDLRSAWVLLRQGYTSQAASVAASLYENALATICLTRSDDNIQEFLKQDDGAIPWSPMNMCKKVISYKGKTPKTKEFENNWRALYAHYVWLCQCKHPTKDSVIHDTSASELKGRGYVVMALPNISEEDTPFKAMVSIMCLQRTHESIQAFASALGYPDELPDDYDFASRLAKAKKLSWEAFNPYLDQKNPISIGKTWFPKKYPPVN